MTLEFNFHYRLSSHYLSKKSISHFLRNSLFFAKLRVPQLLTFVYLQELTLFQKALSHTLSCQFYSPLGIKRLHIAT